MKLQQRLNKYTHSLITGRVLFQHPSAMFVLFQVFSIFAYFELIFTFFQQDEWFTMGRLYAQGISRVWQFGFIDSFILGLGRPLGVLVNYLFFSLFRFNVLPIAIFTIFLHGAVVYLLYRYLIRESVGKLTSFILSVLFLTSSVAISSVSWFAASVTILPSLFFILLSMHSFKSYVNNGRQIDARMAFLYFYIAFLFKEIGAFLGIYFVLQYYLKYKNIRMSVYKTLPYFFMLSMLVIRFTLQQIVKQNHAEFYVSSQGGGIINIVWSSIVTAVASVFQTLVYQTHMYSLAIKLRNYVMQLSGLTGLIELEPMVISISIAGSFALVTMFIIARNYIHARRLLLGVVLYVCLVSPHLLIRKPNSYMELRFYYALIPPLLIAFSSIQYERFHKIIKGLLCVISFIVIVGNFVTVRNVIHKETQAAKVRKDLVASFDTFNLSNSKKNIFFIESENNYIVENQPLPFQQGIGYTLMVIYFRQGVIPKSFLMSEKLWNMGSQGIESSSEYMFGVFSNKSTFNETIKKEQNIGDHFFYVRYKDKKIFIEKKILNRNSLL